MTRAEQIRSGTATSGEGFSHALTPLQLGMIYESVMAGRPDINLEQLVIHMDDEAFDMAAMQSAWDALTARHDALRSRFLWEGRDSPVQEVLPRIAVKMDAADWRDRDRAAQDAQLADWLRKDRARGVELDRAPAWRLSWIRLGARRSVLIWTFHHAMLDGRSFTALLREVLEDYTTLQRGQMPEPRAKPPQFIDHCRALDRLDRDAARAHFARKLDGFDTANVIAIHGPTDPHARTKGQRRRSLSRDASARIDAAARRSGTSTATLVHAAWGLVLARASGREEAVFGVTRAGRHLVADGKEIAGCLINTVPLRIRPTPETDIDTLLGAIRQDQLDVRPFEHTALTDIAAASALPGGASLFETAVMFERGSVEDQLRLLGGAWTNRRIEVLEQGALPLTLAVYGGDELDLMLEHDPARIGDTVADRLLDYVANALAALADLPGDTPLSDVDFLSPAERAGLLGMGRPDPVPGAAVPVLAGWRQAVDRSPDAPALSQVGGSDRLSFGDLDTAADRLAALLVAGGVRSGDLVAICLPRSIAFIKAMLAIHKAGATFLPIDPSYPPDAIAHMLDDSGAKLIVGNSASAPDGRAAILLDRVDPPDDAPPAPPDDLARAAYVIYTSGSTGASKGVVVPHRALSGHVAAARAKYGLCPQDKVLQFASLSFDVSIEEILPTLLSGAELILRSEEMAQDLTTFLDTCAALGITVLNLPTAFWHALVDHMDQTGARLPPDVRLTVVGGEAVARRALDRWRAMQPEVRWLNGYGPTEAAITSTVFDPADSDPLEDGEDVPIGRPMAHALAYVLSPDGGLAPRGAPGELWLGGAAVATGYLDRPELTADRFRPDPFAQGGRIYRSGDVVRWRDDGTLAFGGRADRQVKVNGFRIELREVEKALEADADVGLTLAAVDRAGTATARLVAWVTPARLGADLDPDAIREGARNRLPRHMVPAIVPVEAFPKTPGGKVDIAALPRPVAVRRDAGVSDPADAATRQVAGVMAEILQTGGVGPDASFFDLGGHSLLAIRLIGRLERDFGRRLSIADLHAGPTPRAIAATLAGPGRVAGAEHIVPIQPGGTRPPIYGIHVLGTNECFFRPLAAELGPDQPVLGLSVGPLTKDAPITVEDTADLYFRNIQAHQPEGPLCLAAVSQGSFIAYHLAQLLVAAGRDVRMLALFDAAGPDGRALLTGWRRIAVHLSLLRRTGPRYLATPVRNRIGDLRNLIVAARLKRDARLGRDATENPTLEKFVAANTLAIASYRPAPYPGRLTIFRARESLFDSPQAIRGGLGWAGVAAGGFDLIEVDGGHLSMLEAPHVAGLARALAGVIDTAGTETG